LQTPAPFVELWNDRAAPRGIVERPITINAANARRAAPIEVEDSARQQTTTPSTAADDNLLWFMLWFGLGVAFIAAALFGPKASEILQQRCGFLLLKFIGRQDSHLARAQQLWSE
jgi:hypothetical protein